MRGQAVPNLQAVCRTGDGQEEFLGRTFGHTLDLRDAAQRQEDDVAHRKPHTGRSQAVRQFVDHDT